MRTSLARVALLAATLLGTAAAQAADLPMRRAAPPLPLPAAFTWTGFYFGATLGYGVDSDTSRLRSFTTPFFLDANGAPYLPNNLRRDRDGVVAGGTVGYNLEIQRGLVIGLEGDFSYMDGRTKATNATYFNGAVNVPFSITTGTRVEWLSTVRARLGFEIMPSLLFYGTAGLAFGEVKNRALYTEACCGPISGNSSSVRTGYAVGTGLEYALSQNWTIKGEYLFYDLGSQRVRGDSFDPAFPAEFYTYKVETRGHIARAGINYKF